MTYSDTILDLESNIVRYATEGVFNGALTLAVKELADLWNCVRQSGSEGESLQRTAPIRLAPDSVYRRYVTTQPVRYGSKLFVALWDERVNVGQLRYGRWCWMSCAMRHAKLWCTSCGGQQPPWRPCSTSCIAMPCRLRKTTGKEIKREWKQDTKTNKE